jgi:ABC-type transporter Mla subunit MlaD
VSGTSQIDRLSRRIRLAVGQRLLLGLAPALLAVVVVVALAYYGEIGREAPEYVVAGAAILALL